MIVYLALFLIVLSRIAISLGLFHNALPTILIHILSYVLFLCKFRKEFILLFQENKVLKYFSFISLMLIVWGMIISHTVEQYALCIENIVVPLFPIWIVLMRQPQNKKYFRFIIWTIFILGFAKYIGEYDQSMNNYGGYTSVLYFYIVFIPYINNKYKMALIVFCLMSFMYDPTDRTHMIMMTGCLLCSLIQYLNLKRVSINVWNMIHKTMIIFPLVFIFLLFVGAFNIFHYSESSDFKFLQEGDNVDTRTDLYYEVMNDQGDVLSWIIGKSYVGAYNSGLVDSFMRMGCEVGVLEVLIRGGLVYLIIVMLLFYRNSRLLLCNSKNRMCKSLGCFILLYWTFFFVELQIGVGMWNIALWMAFGISMNPVIRNMSDIEVRKYFHDVISLKLK